MGKPKGKTPSLLAQSTGKPSVHSYNRKTTCCRCKESIASGIKCFQIPKAQSGFTSQKPHCLGCFRQILEKTKSDILELETSLNEVS